MIESLLLTCVQISTYKAKNSLTNASGFFFARDDRLYLVTSKHVLFDEPSAHFPDRIEIEIHIDQDNLAKSINYSIPLYHHEQAIWRQGKDSAGDVDIAVIEIEKQNLPVTAAYFAFTPQHLHDAIEKIDIGTRMLIVGFPMGFHDTLHHLPVARHAINASSFSLRFQGKGYFLTDGRMHRGMSGAPVVMKAKSSSPISTCAVPWILLGSHSTRLDSGTRDRKVDEALGLNCAWFADFLLSLTTD